MELFGSKGKKKGKRERKKERKKQERRKEFLICIQQDATFLGLFYPETVLHFSGGTSTHHQESIQLYLQHLRSNSSTIVAGSSNGMTNTRCCRYSCLPAGNDKRE
jgi:hypothetical protein